MKAPKNSNFFLVFKASATVPKTTYLTTYSIPVPVIGLFMFELNEDGQIPGRLKE